MRSTHAIVCSQRTRRYCVGAWHLSVCMALGQATLSLPFPACALSQDESGVPQETPLPARPDVPTWLTGPILDDLNSPVLNRRDKAWERLTVATDISHAEILELLRERRDTLTPEQQDRLLTAAEIRYLQRLAVIGIQMKTGVVPITIDKVFPDAPAADVLKVDDQVLAINHVELPDDRGPSVLQSTITALEAGEIVTLDIVRDGQPMLVDVELANAFSLENFATLQLVSNRRRHWADLVKDIRPMPTLVLVRPVQLLPNPSAGSPGAIPAESITDPEGAGGKPLVPGRNQPPTRKQPDGTNNRTEPERTGG